MITVTTKEAPVELQLAEAVTAPMSEENEMRTTLATPAVDAHVDGGGVVLSARRQEPLARMHFTEARRRADEIAKAIESLAVEDRNGGRIVFDSLDDARSAIDALNSAADELARKAAETRRTLTLTGDRARTVANQLRERGGALIRYWRKGDQSDAEIFVAGQAFADQYKTKGDTWSWACDKRKPKDVAHYEFLGVMDLVSYDPDTATAVLVEIRVTDDA